MSDLQLEQDAKNKIVSILKSEDAVSFLVLQIKKDERIFAGYGYDVYVTKAIVAWVNERLTVLPKPSSWSTAEHFLSNIPYLSEMFFSAAWELCRLGAIRPGIKSYNVQSTEDGSAGNGYSLTPFGRQWLTEITANNIFITTEPGRFSEMITPYALSFGDGFKKRANEAIRCYGAHAYLACCAMCGAGAESILLHLAIKKDGVEERVLKMYRASNGRKRIEDLIVASQKVQFKLDFGATFNLLKYWRDESAHGRSSNIDEKEAYTSLSLLLRCAQFAHDNYTLLTASNNVED